MSRVVSSVVFGAFVAGVIATASGCKAELTVKTKTGYTATDAKDDTADWAGQPIVIRSEGTGIAVNGGVKVTVDPNITKIHVDVRYRANTFPEEKADADASIAEAKNTFVITNTPTGITVTCGHGNTHNNSASGESGCELMTVHIPVGTAAKPLSVEAHSGNGGLEVQLTGSPITKLEAHSFNGLLNAQFEGTKGANVLLIGEQGADVQANLPTDFAADKVTLQATDGKLNLGPFTDITTHDGTTGRGTAGTGLATLNLTSTEFAGSTGTVTLQ